MYERGLASTTRSSAIRVSATSARLRAPSLNFSPLLLGEQIDDHGAQVVPVAGVLRAGIAEPDDDPRATVGPMGYAPAGCIG